MTDRLLGGLEHVVLLATLHFGEDECYAVPLRSLIEERGGRKLSRGALYTVLERLEAKRYLRSVMGESSPTRGGRAKRYYQVTPSGIRALQVSKQTIAALSEDLGSALEGGS